MSVNTIHEASPISPAPQRTRRAAAIVQALAESGEPLDKASRIRRLDQMVLPAGRCRRRRVVATQLVAGPGNGSARSRRLGRSLHRVSGRAQRRRRHVGALASCDEQSRVWHGCGPPLRGAPHSPCAQYRRRRRDQPACVRASPAHHDQVPIHSSGPRRDRHREGRCGVVTTSLAPRSIDEVLRGARARLTRLGPVAALRCGSTGRATGRHQAGSATS